MSQQEYPVKTLKIEREKGVDIDGVSMSGTGVYDAEKEQFVFQKTPKRQKSAPKNPAVFTGDYMNMRLQQNGSRRVTIMLHQNTIVSEVLSDIIKELKECLSSIQ